MTNETPHLHRFNPRNFTCLMCGKPADGELIGATNENYGLHCQRCADRRLKNSAKIREQMARSA